MITQYSHQQITLSDREKEYAWFHYAAQIINAGCMDQSLSGYSITGTGSDGKTVSAELTNEELFQIFSEVTTKYGKELIKARMQEGKVIGYADIQIGNELRIDKVRIRNNEGKKSVMYPSESMGSGVNRKWHNLASELPDSRLHEKILQVFEEEQRKHQRQTGRSHSHRSEREPEEEEEWER